LLFRLETQLLIRQALRINVSAVLVVTTMVLDYGPTLGNEIDGDGVLVDFGDGQGIDRPEAARVNQK
jgi:hypothetical protein